MKDSLEKLIGALDSAFPESFETELEKRLPEIVKAAGKWSTNPAATEEPYEPAERRFSQSTQRTRATKDETAARAEKILSNAVHFETFTASDAARWCEVDSRLVSPILRGLVELGKLTKTGEKRATVYSLVAGA